MDLFPEAITILDAGSVHEGTEALADKVDWLITSSKFARSKTGEQDLTKATKVLAKINPQSICTDGENGCFWSVNGDNGHLHSYQVDTVDSNGAGDVFHGAFAYGLVSDYEFADNLNFASKMAALSCTGKGIRGNIGKNK